MKEYTVKLENIVTKEKFKTNYLGSSLDDVKRHVGWMEAKIEIYDTVTNRLLSTRPWDDSDTQYIEDAGIYGVPAGYKDWVDE